MFNLTVFSSFVLILAFINGGSTKVAPSYIKTCPGLKSDCLKKTVQEILPSFTKGVPELDIDATDPLREDNVNVLLPGGFKVEFRNGSMTGLRKCNVDSVWYKDNEADLKMHCDLTIKGKYKAVGRILIVAINGDGNAKIKIKNDELHSRIKFHDVVRDGVVYHEVKSIEITQNYGDKVTFGLTNLFQGNPELSEAVLQFLNQNWKQVSEEFGKPLVDRLIDIISKKIKHFFAVVPKNELFVE